MKNKEPNNDDTRGILYWHDVQLVADISRALNTYEPSDDDSEYICVQLRYRGGSNKLIGTFIPDSSVPAWHFLPYQD